MRTGIRFNPSMGAIAIALSVVSTMTCFMIIGSLLVVTALTSHEFFCISTSNTTLFCMNKYGAYNKTSYHELYDKNHIYLRYSCHLNNTYVDTTHTRLCDDNALGWGLTFIFSSLLFFILIILYPIKIPSDENTRLLAERSTDI